MNKTKLLIPLFVLAALAAGLAGYYFVTRTAEPFVPGMQDRNTGKRGDDERKILYYRSPMNPNVTSPVPKQDSMGMPFVPVYAHEQANGAVVEISPAVVNNLGVRTTTVKHGDLPRIIRTVGYVSYDKSLTPRVTVRAAGWIAKAPIDSVGERLKKGDLLLTLYSPTLITAEQEFLTALASGNQGLIEASRARLVALGLSEDQIDRIARTREPIRTLRFTAPREGLVTELNIRAGQYVTPKTELMTISDLSRVWVIVRVFERQANWVKVGDAVRIQLPALPGEVLTGKVQFIYPHLNPVTRTLKVRLSLANPDVALKPNMYVDARILAAPEENAIYVPRPAVIREGDSAHVIVALGDGRFAPREVTLGIEPRDRVQILDGLKAGEHVVTSAQFLIDSQASLEAALQRLSSAGAMQ
ncbi:MAG: efflux RND transporter periplasmic adaptor subunit [Salinisphaera sp.]|nr:efflux RND transporter periplasmic adaptor subunit [Salinisphaera sp.]